MFSCIHIQTTSSPHNLTTLTFIYLCVYCVYLSKKLHLVTSTGSENIVQTKKLISKQYIHANVRFEHFPIFTELMCYCKTICKCGSVLKGCWFKSYSVVVCSLHLSVCPWARNWTPDCSKWGWWRLAWQHTPVLMWVNGTFTLACLGLAWLGTVCLGMVLFRLARLPWDR